MGQFALYGNHLFHLFERFVIEIFLTGKYEDVVRGQIADGDAFPDVPNFFHQGILNKHDFSPAHVEKPFVLSKYFRDLKINNLTVVSPDVGNMKMASKYATHLGGDLAIVHKKRLSGSKVEAQEIIGEVRGRNILMCDDIIATAGTICSAAGLAKQRGAEKVYVGATHGVFAPQALERLAKAPIDRVVVTDTIPQNKTSKKISNIKVLSVAAMLGEAIKRIHRNESISNLFNNI